MLDKLNLPGKIAEEYKFRELVDKVSDYIAICESDNDSEYHWRYLKALYEKLSTAERLASKYLTILEILEPFILKHGQFDSGDTVALDAQNMFKYK